MSESIGRSMSLPLGRRITCDFLALSMKVPTVAIQKQMNVADLVAARRAARTRPSWSSIFTKAYAKVVASRVDLRRTLLTFPWQRMFEYTSTTADIVVEARVRDEDVLLTLPVKRPDTRPLLEIDQLLSWAKEDPLGRVRNFRRAMNLARFPAIMRSWVWWHLLNISGRKRARYFGTFGVTSVGNWGVDSLRPLSPWISLLHFGAIDPRGNVTVRLTYDHRVLDGSGPAKALNEMEQFLNADLHAELRSLAEEPPQLQAG